MTDTEQGHVSAGSPDGGQWTGKHQTHPEAPLAENATGSFLFPPMDYESVESYISYWRNVPISDRVLSNLVTAYAARRFGWIGEELDKWAANLGEDPEWRAWCKNPKTSAPQIDAEHAKRRAAEIDRLAELRPKEIGAMAARNVAIAAQLYQWSGAFSDEEQDEIESHQLRLSRDGSTQSVREIYKKYALQEIVDRAFTENDLSVTYELQGLRHKIGADDSLNG